MKKFILTLGLLLTVTTSCQEKKQNKQMTEAEENAAMEEYRKAPNNYWPTNINEEGDYYFRTSICSFPNNLSEDAGSHFLTNKKAIGFGQMGNGLWPQADNEFGSSTHHAIPNKLIAQWFSIAENKFYRGEFDLPADVIKTNLDKMWSVNNPEKTFSEANKFQRYECLIVGVAPKGGVALWMKSSLGEIIEIGYYKAKEAQISWDDMAKYMRAGPNSTRESFIKNMQYKVRGEIQYGKAEQYREKYNWRPKIEYVFTDTKTEQPKNFIFRYNLELLNGEKECLYNENNNKNIFKIRTLPKMIHFRWKSLKNIDLACNINFNDEEILNAFSQLNKTSKEQIEIVLKLDKDDEIFAVIFRSKTNQLAIRPAKVEVWKLDESFFGAKPLIEE